MFDLKEESSEFKKPEPLASLVKRLGNPESTTLLYSSCQVFQIPHVDGAIGYHQIEKCAIVIGDPICLPQDGAELIKSFHLHCQEHRLNVVYLLAHHDFARWAVNNGCRILIQIGSELSINPTQFQIKHKLRWKMNQSIQQGVQIKEYQGFDTALEDQIKSTIQTWIKQKQGAQIHLGNILSSHSNTDKRIFYAQKNDQILGVLTLTPLDLLQGWVVNSYLALLDAPVGTTEHLMCSTFDTLAQENCHFVCLGAISGTALGEMIGLNAFDKALASLIFKMARWFFKLDAKAIYLKKYHPQLRSTYLLCRDKPTISELFAIKHVLNVKLW